MKNNAIPPACPGREETRHRYLDGELKPAEREAFETHLQQCRACQTAWPSCKPSLPG
jgi:anti-sigma factor RsiW